MIADANPSDAAVFNLVVLAAVVGVGLALRRRPPPAGTACGSAEWATDRLLGRWGLVGEASDGVVIGRTLGGKLLRLVDYTNILLIGGTGSGKGVGIVVPNLLSYARGSLVVFDPKGDLWAFAARRAALGQKVVRVAPFAGGDGWNPLDVIVPGPLLVDQARGVAESLIVRGSEPDPHWNAKAVTVCTAILTLVLSRMEGAERSLSSLQDIASDPEMIRAAAAQLRDMGGIPARLGSQLLTLFEPSEALTREGAGVLSTLGRHLSFLDSELVARSVEAVGGFDPRELLAPGPGVTVVLQIPVELLEAQKGLLRCWISTLIRVVGSGGDEGRREVLFLLDEASALGGLDALREALVRGRSAGSRLILVYQSESQVRNAFKDEPTLIHDNCGTHVHLGASGYEHAERLSKSLGEFTHWVGSHGENDGWTRGSGGDGGRQTSGGHSSTLSRQGRPLLRAEEILTLGEEYLIAWHRGLPAPILGHRIRWYADPAFNPDSRRPRRRKPSPQGWVMAVLLLALAGLAVRAKVLGHGYWQPEPGEGVMTTGKDRRGHPGGDGPSGTQGAAERRQPVPREHR